MVLLFLRYYNHIIILRAMISLKKNNSRIFVKMGLFQYVNSNSFFCNSGWLNPHYVFFIFWKRHIIVKQRHQQPMHTDPEIPSGWIWMTIQTNGCPRTFNVVWKRSLMNQNLLFLNKAFSYFVSKYMTKHEFNCFSKMPPKQINCIY